MAGRSKKTSGSRTQQKREGEIGALPERLSDLQTHLLLCLAKYETWIPDKPEHALVYLGDELQHGVGFPAGIDELVDQVLAHGLLTAQTSVGEITPTGNQTRTMTWRRMSFYVASCCTFLIPAKNG